MSASPDQRTARRHFLRGTGGLLLALPFLESLSGRGEAQAMRRPRRFVSMQSPHGGAWGADLHPPQATLTESLDYAGLRVRRGDLTLTVDSGRAQLSPILSAPSSVLTTGLVKKMNVLRGLGVPFYGFHHAGGHLGNWATIEGGLYDMDHRPTIDTLIAYTPTFYERPPLVRVMLCGEDHPMVSAASWFYDNPRQRKGPIVRSAPAGSSLRLFQRIYAPPTPSPQKPRRPIVDRVLADYRRLRTDRRVSQRDRVRLDAHIAHLDELETKLSQPRRTCPATDRPADNSEPRFAEHDSRPELAREALQLWCDVVALAFACDTSRIAVIPIASTFTDWNGTGARDFHQAIAHQAGSDIDPETPPVEPPHPRFRMAEGYQRVFEHGFLYLARKLDELDDGEGTLLDTSLITWTHEAGIQTHEQTDMPVITAGSAGGAIKTGMHADYRNLAFRALNPDRVLPEPLYPGLHWHQYLGSVLQIMGVPASEYVQGSYGGYGDEFAPPAARASGQWPEATFRARGDVLPFLV
ncbi:MAG: DUF1552 domain-containing protein [Myxococcales bacterium]|nr:DUF1552 domain-containing protein [Myxococcales bacterium]